MTDQIVLKKILAEESSGVVPFFVMLKRKDIPIKYRSNDVFFEPEKYKVDLTLSLDSVIYKVMIDGCPDQIVLKKIDTDISDCDPITNGKN